VAFLFLSPLWRSYLNLPQRFPARASVKKPLAVISEPIMLTKK